MLTGEHRNDVAVSHTLDAHDGVIFRYAGWVGGS